MTPRWLYCEPPHRSVTQGWPALPRGATCALLHLVELRSQFVSFRSLDTVKYNRPYVMAAYDAWPVDDPAAQPPLPPMSDAARNAVIEVRRDAGEPADANRSSLRVVRLSQALIEATSNHQGVGALLNALQVLHVVAAISGRAPLVPSVPCSASWLVKDPLGAVGVSDDYVMPLWDTGMFTAAPSHGLPADVSSNDGVNDGEEEHDVNWLVAEARAKSKVKCEAACVARGFFKARCSEFCVVGYWQGGNGALIRRGFASNGTTGGAAGGSGVAAIGGAGGTGRANAGGGYRCHLSIGGAQCAWPNVVPAWLQSVRTLYGGRSPEAVPAPAVSPARCEPPLSHFGRAPLLHKDCRRHPL